MAIAFVLWTVVATAQDYTVSRHFNVASGLTNDFVVELAIDGQGFLWVATEAGVSRVAGNTCQEIKVADIRPVMTSALYHQPSNQVLLGSEKGLSIYDCQKHRLWQATKELGFHPVNVEALCAAHDGGVWIAYGTGHVQYWKGDESKPIDIPIAERFSCHSAMDDGRGHLYLGHWTGGMSIVHPSDGSTERFTHQPDDTSSIPGNNVRSITQDSQGRVWVGTDHGLALFHPDTKTFTKVKREDDSYDDNVYDIREMSDGNLWVATDLGGIRIVCLRQVTDQDDELSYQPADIRLSSINTRCIQQDAFNNIWVGNHSTGVDFISAQRRQFHLINYLGPSGLPKPVYAMADDDDGQFWIGSEDELTLWHDYEMKARWPVQSKMRREHSFPRCMIADHSGHVWLGMEDEGVIRFNKGSGTFERIDIGLEAPDIHSFMEDDDGRIWIGSQGGVFTYKDGVVSHEQRLSQITLNGPVTGFLRLNAEEMVLATLGSGVFVVNLHSMTAIRMTEQDGLPSNKVNQIMSDCQHGLWVATYDGLAYIDDVSHLRGITVYNAQQGLSDQHVRAMQQDAAGRVWVSTFSGISCLDRRVGRFYNYNHFDQQQLSGFSVAATMMAPDGSISFGAANGACRLHPLDFNHDQVSKVQIVACEAYNPTGSNTEIVQLAPDSQGRVRTNYQQNTLRMVFALSNYAQTGQEEYSYMMKGMDNKWYYIGNDQEVVFRGLRPGHYTFILRAKLKSQDWEEASVEELFIHIAPPFWKSWWAYTLYVLALLLWGWYMVRSYNRRVMLRHSLELEKRESLQKQALNEERLRFFTNVTHELRTPLTLIMGPLDDLSSDSQLPSDARRRVTMIQKSAQQLSNLINDILEFRKTETQNRRLTVARGDLAQLVREICLNYHELHRKGKVTFSYDIPDHLPLVYFDSEIITTILNNFLSNAIKYTEQGTITVTARADDHWWSIAVADTGYGIAAHALPHVFERYYQAHGSHQASGTGIGLALVKSLADLHEAQLDVVSQEGKGSCFTLSLDIGNTYPNALHKEDKPEAATNETGGETSADISDQPTLLVVEDNADICQYIADSLASDFRILQAANGQEGLQMAQETIPDIIVSDIMMPRMNGIEMTRLLKNSISTSHIPIILLTAKVTDDDKQEGYESGADSYLTKPFTAKLLASRIHNLLAARRRLAELISARTMAAAPASNEVVAAEPQLNRLDREFIERLDRVIRENIMLEDLDMPFMTDKMAMSHSTFYRKVKALTGMTAKEYIRKSRLRHCYQLLESGDYNVTEAAMMTGFNQMAHFREIFRREFGKAPSEVMRKNDRKN